MMNSDDDQIETSVQFRAIRDPISGRKSITPDEPRSSPLPDLPKPGEESLLLGHGVTADGESACCEQIAHGAVDCNFCITNAVSDFLASLGEGEKASAATILSVVRTSGTAGITRDQLSVCHPYTMHSDLLLLTSL